MTLEPSTYFDIENVQVEVDKFENELFLQAEVDYWNGNGNITSVQANLSIYQSGGFRSIGSFNLADDGQDGDIIPGNRIYSLLTTADQLDISDIEAEIKSINMASHYELSQSDNDSLDIELTVSGKLLKVIFTAEDADGDTTQYTEYTNLSNTYIEIQINSDGMFRDIDSNDECNRQWNQTNHEYIYYFNIMNTSPLGSSNNFNYSTKIPFRPLDECGGTGEALFKFNVHDMDFANCFATEESSCSSNLTSTEELSLIISGCNDGWCTEDYENNLSCPSDCYCDNGTCDGDEDNLSCPEDCE